MSLFQSGVLLFSGGAITGFGLWRVVDPVSFMAFNGMAVDAADVSLMNELRGMGSMPLGFGLVALSGVVFPKTMRKTSLITQNVLFWTFLSARLFSMALDGKPDPKILEGMQYEFVLGSLNAVALYQFLTKEETKDKNT